MPTMDVLQLFTDATRAHRAGDPPNAERLYRAALLLQPAHAEALHLLGTLLAQTGRTADAVPLLREAARLLPDNAPLHSNLGEALRRNGDLPGAVASLRRATELRPSFPEAQYNLGNALKASGRHAEAIEAYRVAVALRPGYAEAHYNLANALREFGLVKASVGSYSAALALRPEWADAHMNLGNAYGELARTSEALESYRRAISLGSKTPELLVSIGHTYRARGDAEQARVHYREAAELQPGAWTERFRADTVCELIAPDAEYANRREAELLATVRAAADGATSPLDLSRLHHSSIEPPMALAYYGLNDIDLKRAYAELFQPRITPPPLTVSRGGRPHVGFVVTHGHEGVFYKCMGGVIDAMPGRDLRVSICCSRSGENVLRQWVRNPGVEFLVLPSRLDEAARRIADSQIHLLHYWEIGTDSTNYFLPYLKAAPIQCATWGWPATSGIPQIDDYVSSELLEVADAEAHYTERLVRLPSLPTSYRYPPVSTGAIDRGQFGLGADDRVYLCQQNLRKCQPAFDALLGELVDADPEAVVLLIADEQQAVTQALAARLQRTQPTAFGRVRIMPRMPEVEYLRLVATADVVLDTPGYGGGANTVYDAVAAATPTVTLTGNLHRTRWATAANRKLALDPLNATDVAAYVATAIRITKDADYRSSLEERLRAAGEQLFNDRAPARELRQYLCERIASI